MNKNQLRSFYKDKKVFITGHTGFKGSWLSIWLRELGASVFGYALVPETTPALFELAGLENNITSIIGDVRDFEHLNQSVKQINPEIIFHLAAQPLVRASYIDPITTYQTNVLGLVNLLEIIRQQKSVKAVVIVTSDKCYENKEWVWGYRENDALGGHDPYSSSKACAEIIIDSYRKSFFNDRDIQIASARAGNVIGGGDWAEDRLIPDIVRAITKNETCIIRNPGATRPWQHVLEPLSGYLLLMKKLYESGNEFGSAWNFGPDGTEEMTVHEIIDFITLHWKGRYKIVTKENAPHEAHSLKLDCSKANKILKWKPTFEITDSLQFTIDWHKSFTSENDIYQLCTQQISSYTKIAQDKKIDWALV